MEVNMRRKSNLKQANSKSFESSSSQPQMHQQLNGLLSEMFYEDDLYEMREGLAKMRDQIKDMLPLQAHYWP
jgi:hypothetical protein